MGESLAKRVKELLKPINRVRCMQPKQRNKQNIKGTDAMKEVLE